MSPYWLVQARASSYPSSGHDDGPDRIACSRNCSEAASTTARRHRWAGVHRVMLVMAVTGSSSI